METILIGLEEILLTLAEFGSVIFEFVGVLIVLYTGIKAIIGIIKKDREVQLKLAEGFPLALTFLLGGEILKTVVSKELSDILMVAATMALRAAMSILLHWEIKNEKSEEEKEE